MKVNKRRALIHLQNNPLLLLRWDVLFRWPFLLDSIVPISVTFILLYRSCWHSELSGWARTCCVLALSCITLAIELIVIGIMLCIAVFCVNALSVTRDPG
jgi:hypothetical protein